MAAKIGYKMFRIGINKKKKKMKDAEPPAGRYFRCEYCLSGQLDSI